jgi:hypothetical protein
MFNLGIIAATGRSTPKELSLDYQKLSGIRIPKNSVNHLECGGLKPL